MSDEVKEMSQATAAPCQKLWLMLSCAYPPFNFYSTLKHSQSINQSIFVYLM